MQFFEYSAGCACFKSCDGVTTAAGCQTRGWGVNQTRMNTCADTCNPLIMAVRRGGGGEPDANEHVYGHLQPINHSLSAH